MAIRGPTTGEFITARDACVSLSWQIQVVSEGSYAVPLRAPFYPCIPLVLIFFSVVYTFKYLLALLVFSVGSRSGEHRDLGQPREEEAVPPPGCCCRFYSRLIGTAWVLCIAASARRTTGGEDRGDAEVSPRGSREARRELPSPLAIGCCPGGHLSCGQAGLFSFFYLLVPPRRNCSLLGFYFFSSFPFSSFYFFFPLLNSCNV